MGTMAAIIMNLPLAFYSRTHLRLCRVCVR